jgi:uncharacterized membrane protein (UPF0127 family)
MVSRDRVLALVAVVACVTVAALVASPGVRYGLLGGGPPDDDTAAVTLIDADGTQLATVGVRVADTRSERYVGLSETDSLAAGEGMLFVHPQEGTHAYVMRNMSFPLDIVFVATNGTVTAVHHAGVPPPGTTGSDLARYRGRGKYVLEVPRGYANRTGLDEGDRVEVPSSV